MFIYLIMWLFAGLFFCIFIALKDVYNFCLLLTMHKGCKEAKGLEDLIEDDEVDENLEVTVYEDVRIVVIEKYLEIRNGLKKKEAEENTKETVEEEDEEENPIEVKFE